VSSKAVQGASKPAGDLADGRFSLVPVLCAAALFEIIFYRVLRPLLRPEADVLPRWLQRGLEAAGDFSLNLIKVLSLVVLALGLWQVVGRGVLGPSRGGRLAFALIAAFYLPLSAVMLIFPGQVESLGLGLARAAFFSQVSFICLALLTLLSALPARGQGRVKLGLLLFLVPLALHFEAYFNTATGRGRPETIEDLLVLGQGAAVAAIFASPLCFLPFPRSRATDKKSAPRGWIALSAGAALLCGLTLCGVVMADWEMAAQLFQAVAGLRLPTVRWIQGLYLVAVMDFIFAAVALLCRGGALQVRGFGLLLIGLGGYRLQENHELAVVLLGLLCISRSALFLPGPGAGHPGQRTPPRAMR
jgi:hypothetical protein